MTIKKNLHTVPAWTCDSKTMIDANSRLMDVDKCERAAM